MSAAVSSSPGYKYYVLFLLFLVSVINFMDRQVFSLLIESIKQDLDVSDTRIGLLAGFGFAIFHSIAGLPLARIADTGSRRMVIAVGMFSWSVFTVACGLSANFIQLALARLGVGVGEATGTPTSHSLISDYFPKDRRAMALGFMSVGATTGVLIASLAGGWINQLYGWRAAFIILGIPGIAVSLVIYFTLKEPVRGQLDGKAYQPAASIMASVRSLLAIRCYPHIVMAAALHGFIGFTGLFWNPAYMQRVHGLTSGEAGTMLAFLAPPFTALGMIAMGQASDVRARKDMRWYPWIIAITTLLYVPFLLMFLFIPSRSGLYFLAGMSFFTAAGVPALHALTQYIAPANSRAMAAAINVTIISLAGSGIGAALIGILNDALTPAFGQFAIRYSLSINVIGALWCAFHAMMAARTLREHTDKTAAA